MQSLGRGHKSTSTPRLSSSRFQEPALAQRGPWTLLLLHGQHWELLQLSTELSNPQFPPWLGNWVGRSFQHQQESMQKIIVSQNSWLEISTKLWDGHRWADHGTQRLINLFWPSCWQRGIFSWTQVCNESASLHASFRWCHGLGAAAQELRRQIGWHQSTKTTGFTKKWLMVDDWKKGIFFSIILK